MVDTPKPNVNSDEIKKSEGTQHDISEVNKQYTKLHQRSLVALSGLPISLYQHVGAVIVKAAMESSSD